MKTALIFVLIVGATSAQLLGGLSSITSSLKSLDISNLDGVKSLANALGVDTVLEQAGSIFLKRFSGSKFLEGQSGADTVKNFIANAKEVLNAPAAQGWKSSLNIELLGLSREDYESLLTARSPTPAERGNQSDNIGSSASRKKRQTTTLPASIDWRTKGAVTPVKNQGNCGSCWAFTANVSGQGCCYGCDGGWMTDAYNYVKLNTGINGNASYPYETKQLTCRYKSTDKAGTATGFTYTAQDDENDLKKAVAAGVVATAVDATNFTTYAGGVFSCPKFTALNHGVLITGYGTDAKLGDYWLVKNSWGTGWGESGYIRIARNKGYPASCGIASASNYPTV
ncbi:Cathepsin L [Orchesella cincta]|uniref:Cathepsin L n=1 Tax=Orchesella cincta TaxID=48709 RepID=A0A1D2ML61_ORCCI|nr:Cathepsin L [Orchesella cincta]